MLIERVKMSCFINCGAVITRRRGLCVTNSVYFSLPELNRISKKQVGEGSPPDDRRSVFVPTVDGRYNLIVVQDEKEEGAEMKPLFLQKDDVNAILKKDGVQTALLGDYEGKSYFALDVEDDDSDPLDIQKQNRKIKRVSRLPLVAKDMRQSDVSILSYAKGLMWFHRNVRFCSKCGTKMTSASEGKGRSCSSCNKTTYPRVDPAIITLITHEDQCLLGRKASWGKGRFSLLAGFGEVGETLEDTVVREVKEESDIDVERSTIQYHSSQPWPFPTSLMIGFSAKAKSTAITVDTNELEDCKWFSKNYIRQKLENGGDEEFNIPSNYALANRMISEWTFDDSAST